eukprot:9490131-Pyramimonas_sp.AAC.1
MIYFHTASAHAVVIFHPSSSSPPEFSLVYMAVPLHSAAAYPVAAVPSRLACSSDSVRASRPASAPPRIRARNTRRF